MKKIICLIMTIVLLIPTVALGYDTDKFSIEIPEKYTASAGLNSFTDDSGHNINVQVTESKNEKVVFNDEYLDVLTKELTDNIDEYRQEVKQQLIAQYDGQVEESAIENIVNSIQYKDFVKKEIVNFGADDYKGFHYISDISVLDSESYTETYQTYYNDTIYTITISSDDLTMFDSEEIINTVKSFKIKGFVEDTVRDISEVTTTDVTSAPVNNKLTSTEIVIVACGVLIIIFALIGISSKTKAEKRLDEEKNNDDK